MPIFCNFFAKPKLIHDFLQISCRWLQSDYNMQWVEQSRLQFPVNDWSELHACAVCTLKRVEIFSSRTGRHKLAFHMWVRSIILYVGDETTQKLNFHFIFIEKILDGTMPKGTCNYGNRRQEELNQKKALFYVK